MSRNCSCFVFSVSAFYYVLCIYQKYIVQYYSSDTIRAKLLVKAKYLAEKAKTCAGNGTA
jgi:hypothetical protein